MDNTILIVFTAPCLLNGKVYQRGDTLEVDANTARFLSKWGNYIVLDGGNKND